MLENYLVRGLFIGLIFGVPAGAIGALTVQRTLNGGFSAGLSTGLGSSVADVLYACVGVFGITLVSDFLTQNQQSVSLLGGLMIVMLGLHTLRQKPQNRQQDAGRTGLLLCFLSSFVIAITNPATVLSFLMAFTAFEITGRQTSVQSIQLIAGILLGTLSWWSVLSGATAIFRECINDRIYQLLTWLLGCLMIGFGGIILIRGILS